jgi:hypothetical protein
MLKEIVVTYEDNIQHMGENLRKTTKISDRIVHLSSEISRLLYRNAKHRATTFFRMHEALPPRHLHDFLRVVFKPKDTLPLYIRQLILR